MKVLVTKDKKEDFERYTVVDSIVKVLKMENVECVILNSCIENDNAISQVINGLRTKFSCRFFYISEEPTAFISLIISSVQGVILSDEYCLQNEDELDAVMDFYNVGSTALMVSDMQSCLGVVKDFVVAYARGEERCSLPYFIQQTNMALSELEASIGRKDLQIQEMGTSAVNVLQRAINYINTIEERNKTLSQQLSSLTQQISTPRNKFNGGGGVAFYPTVKWNAPPTKKVLVIREYSPCRYLTSFILSYCSYLRTIKNRRVKLIFTVQKGATVLQRYNNNNIVTITQDSLSRTDLYSRDTIVTNTPQSQVLINMLNAGTFDTVVVVDRLYGGDQILKGTGIKLLNAVGGSSDLTKFGLRAQTCIFSHIDYPNCFLTIPTLTKYPPANSVDLRVASYAQLCNKLDLYKTMDKYLEIDARR